MTDRKEGLHRSDAGTVSPEGFIAPSIGLVDHALYFTSAPDVVAKTQQVLDAGRLGLPGAVIVWDETIGRRKGSKAVPGTWWATAGSVTMALVFPAEDIGACENPVAEVGASVVEAISSFGPSDPVSYSDGELFLGGKLLGQVKYQRYDGNDVFVVRVNANTDFTNAPQEVRNRSSRLVDCIDVSALPLGRPGTLANSFSKAIMTEVPSALGYS